MLPLLIPSLFEVRHVAYFSPIQETFDKKIIFFLHQHGVTF